MSKSIIEGKIRSGAFWLGQESWLIENPNIPLFDSLTAQLQSLQEYIDRLESRANNLAKWLENNKNQDRNCWIFYPPGKECYERR